MEKFLVVGKTVVEFILVDPLNTLVRIIFTQQAERQAQQSTFRLQVAQLLTNQEPT